MSNTEYGDHGRGFSQKVEVKPPCGAKTRSGAPCQNPPTRWSHRCRMHGGAPGSGAPEGNRNALKHGLYTRKAIQARRELAVYRREAAKYDNSWIDVVMRKRQRMLEKQAREAAQKGLPKPSSLTPENEDKLQRLIYRLRDGTR